MKRYSEFIVKKKIKNNEKLESYKQILIKLIQNIINKCLCNFRGLNNFFNSLLSMPP